MRRRAEAVDAEPAARWQRGAPQRAEADDPGAQQRRRLLVVEPVRQAVGEALVDDGVLGVPAVGVPPGERAGRGTGSRRRAGRTGTARTCGAARPRRSARRARSASPPAPRCVDDADDLVAGHDVGAVRGEVALRPGADRSGTPRRPRPGRAPRRARAAASARSTSASGSPSIGPGPSHHPRLHHRGRLPQQGGVRKGIEIGREGRQILKRFFLPPRGQTPTCSPLRSKPPI